MLLLISFHKTFKQGRIGNVAKACGPWEEKMKRNIGEEKDDEGDDNDEEME